MNSRGNYRSRGYGNRKYYDHDDRGEPSSSNFRGGSRGRQNWSRNSYKHGRNRGGFQKRTYANNYEEDIPMRENKGDRHKYYYENARGGHRRNYKNFKNSARDPYKLSNASGWHKVIIRNAANLDQEDVLSCIRNHIDEDFTPHLYGKYKEDLSFYIEGNLGVARSLINMSGRMNMDNGQRLTIRCLDAVPPSTSLTSTQLNFAERAMANRFSTELSRIDLRRFHSDKVLIEQKIFCPLYRQSNLEAIIGIIHKNIPNLEEVDLSENQISHNLGLKGLLKCSNLKILNLGKNKIRHDNFNALTGLGITELVLEGNQVCDKFKDGKAYYSALRKFFPKLIRLDGVDLPKPINFGFEDDNLGLIPASRPSFFASDEVKNVILQFIEQYYQVFESNDRRPLEAAYTVDAKFSFSTSLQDFGWKGGAELMKANRNLLRGSYEKAPLLTGNKSIADFLCKLPSCSHFPHTFIVDTPFVVPQLMEVFLRGVFKSSEKSSSRFYSFARSLIIVPVGSGFCISNEELFLCLATQDQIAKAQNPQESETPALPPAPSQQTDPLSGLDQAKIEMIQHLCTASKMLPFYSKECLEQNNWDLYKAQEMFLTLQKENKIPAEYYC